MGAGPVTVLAERSTICFYTWGNSECCLAAGATSATLIDKVTDNGESALKLCPGDVLVFEEVMGPRTGVAGDADPTHRHVVRLTETERCTDPLTGDAIVEIAWDGGDALPFALCLSAIGPAPGCCLLTDISVARGNVVLADHGRSRCDPLGAVPTVSSQPPCADGCPDPPQLAVGRFRPQLPGTPLTFQAHYDLHGPAAAVAAVDLRSAVPQLTLVSTTGRMSDALWVARPDLLDSGPGDRHLVAEIDDDAIAHLRFGDDTLGRAPAAGEQFTAHSRVGLGPIGNVGPESVGHVVCEAVFSAADVRVRNPMPAVGGIAPEPVAEVKKLAPYAMHRDRQRAITAADYAELTVRDFPDAVQRAAAELRWTGSWYEARVSVDSFGTIDPSSDLLDDVEDRLQTYRRIGHDVVVVPAVVVGLDVALQICIADGYRRAQVELMVRARLGSHPLPDGSLGLFHPDAVSFGAVVAASTLVAAAAAVPGVTSARVTRLRRYGQVGRPDTEDVPGEGLLAMAPAEIPRLDNDPAAPEHGVLELDLRGGR